MESPIALKLRSETPPQVYRVCIDSDLANQLKPASHDSGPAVVVTRSAQVLAPIRAGIIDAKDVVAVSGGDWTNSILVVLPEPVVKKPAPAQSPATGDTMFLKEVQRRTPALAQLAEQTVRAVRAAGIKGQLVKEGDRWVNRPLNTFTLKPQPRVLNIHFTLYGNPESYNSDGFLRADQNSYSRGWIRNGADVGRFAEFARLSHGRRSTREV